MAFFRPRMVKSKSIGELFEYIKRSELSEPVTSESLNRDLELSERRDYGVRSEVKSKGCLRAVLPDLTQPLSSVAVEAGAAVVEGFGRAKIRFDESFSDTPTVIAVPFGFIEITVPWVAIEWREFSVLWTTVSIPVPRVTTMTIRLPTMCFLMSVDKEGFEVFNVMGRTTVAYIAFGY